VAGASGGDFVEGAGFALLASYTNLDDFPARILFRVSVLLDDCPFGSVSMSLSIITACGGRHCGEFMPVKISKSQQECNLQCKSKSYLEFALSAAVAVQF
jgi:hypothetical protein